MYLTAWSFITVALVMYWVHCTGYTGPGTLHSEPTAGEFTTFPLISNKLVMPCQVIVQCPENITSGIVSKCLLARVTFWKMMDDDENQYESNLNVMLFVSLVHC